jgi:toxin ParE1/3/4
LGAGRDDIAPGYRSLPVGRHVVYYRGVQANIEIVRVLHGSMDAPRHLEKPTAGD